jgi:hypothetical protein
MESMATLVPRAMSLIPNNSNDQADPPSEPRRARTLFDLVERFQGQESLQNNDVVLPLNRLRMTPEQTIEVPDLGCFAMNDWSRKQAATLLGMRWDRWFENASPIERAQELNHRLARASGEVKVRTTSALEDDAEADGTLRALVTPGYTPIEDSQVASLVITAMGGLDGDMNIIRADMTDRSTSFVVAVGKPYRVGGDGQVGDVWGGMMIRNSGVGFSSLLMVAHLLRLACLNGMVCPIPDAVLLRRRHRGISDDKVRVMLSERLQQLPGMLRQAGETLQASTSRRIEDVDDAVRGVLTQGNLPLRMLDPIMEAYGREPVANAFGVSQAITLAAQRFSPEVRLELEQAAGLYLRGV